MVAAAENPKQDALFDVEIEYRSSGSAEPLGYTPKVVTRIIPYDEKSFPPAESHEREERATVTEAGVATDGVQKVRNRSTEQAGRHSPLQRTGNYADARPGDFLPGFGAVTYSNLEEARQFGTKLDGQRRVPRQRPASE